MNRRLWLDTRGIPVITTTSNGENNAVQWGWTPATAQPLPTREEIAEAIADGWNSVTTLDATAQSIGPTAAADAVLAILTGSRPDEC